MAKAIHLINRREKISFQGMSRWEYEANGYRSCCWLLSDEQASDLLGGWVYFHQTKASQSGFGGVILGFESSHDDISDRKVILFRADSNGRGQDWRGADHGMAYTSGIIDADLEHEQ
jgi:hypothetical protein